MAGSNRVDIKRTRIHIEASGASPGCFAEGVSTWNEAEKHAHGTAYCPFWGQAGLIQAERLASPENPPKKLALVGAYPERPTVEVASSLRSSRFAVIPVTCIHNLEDDVDVEQGVTWEFVRPELTAVSANVMYEVNFEKARYTPGPNESIVIRPGNVKEIGITWEYRDVTEADKIDNDTSPLTRKNLSFQKVVRDDYEFQVGQKVGIAVYRNYELSAEDEGISSNSVTTDELRQIFGREGRVNVYSGQITNVSPGKEAFEHNINTFRGCSGAIIFLLDVDQEGHGVIESDYGKAIGVHVGGDQLECGTIVNFAFKII